MDSPSTPQREKKGLGRLWTKVKLAVKSKSKSKSKSKTKAASSTPDTSTTQTQPLQQTQQVQTPSQPPTVAREQEETTSASPNTNTITTSPTQVQTITQPPLAVTAPDTLPTNTQVPTTVTMQADHTDTSPRIEAEESTKDKSQLAISQAVASSRGKEETARRLERTQAIFKKYNLEFDESRWDIQPKPPVERVLKAPRMRVRWTCHECKTTFGHDKICVECAHQRCKTCVRYPPKKRKARTAKKAATAAAMADTSEEIREGACHECQTPFHLGLEECTNCHHRICERCLQETLSAPEQGEAQPIITT